jgi:hypothetical protein
MKMNDQVYASAALPLSELFFSLYWLYRGWEDRAGDLVAMAKRKYSPRRAVRTRIAHFTDRHLGSLW